MRPVTISVTNRPLAHFSTTMLYRVVERGKLTRYPVELAQQLQAELAIRRLQEKRSN